MGLAVLPLLGTVAVLVHGVNLRSNSTDFRLGVQPAVAGGDQGLRYVADRLDEIPPLLFWEQRMSFALEESGLASCPTIT